MIIFCGGEFTAHKTRTGWKLMQWFKDDDYIPTFCANLVDILEAVGAAKGLSDA
jgi:hypothetical protein